MVRKLLAAALLLVPATAHASWYRAETRHFVVYDDDTPKHVQQFAAQLERFDAALRIFHHIEDYDVGPSGRVTVFVVPNDDRIEALSSEGVRGFYRAEPGEPVAFVPRVSGYGDYFDLDASSVLRHEYAHHFMFTSWQAAALPMWYVEGFAEMHATALVGADGSVTFGKPPRYRAETLLRDGMIAIEEILLHDGTGVAPERLYGYGWLLIDYLSFEPSRAGQLAAYVAALNQGKSRADAAAVFGDIKQLDRDLERFVHRSKLPSVTVAGNAIDIGEVRVRPLTPGEAATIDVRIDTKAGVDKAEAERVVRRARRAAEAFPDDPAAQTELADAEYDAGNFEASDAAASRAIAASPEDVAALICKGKARMALAQAAKSKDPAIWAAVRRWFIAANHVDHTNPLALMLFYESYGAAGEPATDNAEAALLQAYEFAPFSDEIQLDAAFVYLNRDKPAQARLALATVAYDPHGGERAKFAAGLIAQLDAGNIRQALEKLAQGVPPETGGKSGH